MYRVSVLEARYKLEVIFRGFRAVQKTRVFWTLKKVQRTSLGNLVKISGLLDYPPRTDQVEYLMAMAMTIR